MRADVIVLERDGYRLQVPRAVWVEYLELAERRGFARGPGLDGDEALWLEGDIAAELADALARARRTAPARDDDGLRPLDPGRATSIIEWCRGGGFRMERRWW